MAAAAKTPGPYMKETAGTAVMINHFNKRTVGKVTLKALPPGDSLAGRITSE